MLMTCSPYRVGYFYDNRADVRDGAIMIVDTDRTVGFDE
jgi:hypothetical protein